MSGCPFCKESFFPYHKKLGLCIEDAIVFSDEYVFVTPDISPISEGHYLIITWEHYCNFASAPQKVRNSFYNALRFICEKIYKSNDFLSHFIFCSFHQLFCIHIVYSIYNVITKT